MCAVLYYEHKHPHLTHLDVQNAATHSYTCNSTFTITLTPSKAHKHTHTAMLPYPYAVTRVLYCVGASSHIHTS